METGALKARVHCVHGGSCWRSRSWWATGWRSGLGAAWVSSREPREGIIWQDKIRAPSSNLKDMVVLNKLEVRVASYLASFFVQTVWGIVHFCFNATVTLWPHASFSFPSSSLPAHTALLYSATFSSVAWVLLPSLKSLNLVRCLVCFGSSNLAITYATEKWNSYWHHQIGAIRPLPIHLLSRLEEHLGFLGSALCAARLAFRVCIFTVDTHLMLIPVFRSQVKADTCTPTHISLAQRQFESLCDLFDGLIGLTVELDGLNS
jgi:hypothetical protein